MTPSHRSSRRDFLRGKTAADILDSVATDLTGSPAEALELYADGAGADGGYLLRFGRRAMACEFEVLLNARQYARGPEAALGALDLIDELESQLSVYRSESEVSQINQSAERHEVEVEPRLFALLSLAANIHRETRGAYDITSGPLTKTWGFYRREGRMPAESELAAALDCVGLEHVELDGRRSTIRFRKPGMEVNLGSIGKGYALDRVAELLATLGIENFLIHGGNSSVLARGARGKAIERSETVGSGNVPGAAGESTDARGWWIGLRHPHVPQRRIGEILLRDRALGTSGGGTQFFMHEGRRYGHILDPRSGRPAEGVLSVTVAAGTGAQADALATAFFVLGLEQSISYCQEHAEIGMVMMTLSARHGAVVITHCGLADDELQVYADPTLSVRRD